MAAWIFLLAWTSLSFAQETSWPDLSNPARAIGGGENDAAVVVGVEDYLRVPGVPGAKSNAKQWYEYLTETRGVPARNVKFLTNDDATREEILDASRKMAGRAGPEGTLWFVFVGHGAPSADGKDGLLVGVDAQQKADSLEARGLRRQELLKALNQSQAGTIVAVLDACFSGRGQDGATIVSGLQPLVIVSAAKTMYPRMVVLTAAKGNQFAGALPGASRPAFSYLVLGGLRGWAAKGKKVPLTAGDLWRYATDALDATLRGRTQTPDLLGDEDAVVGVSAGEKGPNLSKLAAATAGRSAISPSADTASASKTPRTEASNPNDSIEKQTKKAGPLVVTVDSVRRNNRRTRVFLSIDSQVTTSLEVVNGWLIDSEGNETQIAHSMRTDITSDSKNQVMAETMDSWNLNATQLKPPFDLSLDLGLAYGTIDAKTYSVSFHGLK
ncbi:MAG TPA: hypothetical protein DCM05_00765 [Elusimicrobia bacterium]|nr:hypothetical protein [Elusimicrobiota bacterium]